MPPLSSTLGDLAAASGHRLEPVPIRNLIKTQWLSTPEVLAYLHLCEGKKKLDISLGYILPFFFFPP